MKKLLAAALALLVTAVATPARAEMPCEGSNSSCSWSCNQDAQGNITEYSVSCQQSEWCVGADGSVDLGLCDSVAPPSDDPVKDAIAEVMILDEAMDGGTCDGGGEVSPPKAPYTK